jgi:hypothetical protein
LRVRRVARERPSGNPDSNSSRTNARASQHNFSDDVLQMTKELEFARRRMARLFPKWSNAALRWGIMLAAVLAIVAASAPMVWVRTSYATGQYRDLEQPIAFDHRHHVADDGIDCRYCHNLAERSRYAGVPPSNLCMGCHDQVWNESPLLDPLRRSYFGGRAIPWQRVHRLPDFVFFDHSIHVAKGVGCEECHGRVDLMPRIHQVAPLTMGWCLECHRDPGRHLRPVEDVTKMGWQPKTPRDELARELVDRNHVRSLTSCTTCHR